MAEEFDPGGCTAVTVIMTYHLSVRAQRGASTTPRAEEEDQSVMSRTGARSLSSSGGAEDVISKSLSPDRERVAAGGGGGSGGGGGGDSDDVESLVSFVSGTSALSTQSERPSASYMKRAG